MVAIGKICANCAVLVVLIASLLPVLISWKVGGWMRKYTSPKPFFVKDIPVLSGKVAIVTGANIGIGLETARELARKGAEVVVAARSVQKGEDAVKEIVDSVQADLVKAGLGKAKVRFMQLDLASLPSIQSFAEAFEKTALPLHMLVLNAGIMKSPGASAMGREFHYGYETTEQGFEVHIGVNHIGHFYLTQLLESTLKRSAPARVVAVSSAAEDGAYDAGIRFDLWKERGVDYEDGRAYGQSKLANVLFARELAERWGSSQVMAYSCHPGIIVTALGRYMIEEMDREAKAKGILVALTNSAFMALFNQALFTTADGALTQLHLSVAPQEQLSNGGYYVPIGTLAEPAHSQALNGTLQKLLWDRTRDAIADALK